MGLTLIMAWLGAWRVKRDRDNRIRALELMTPIENASDELCADDLNT